MRIKPAAIVLAVLWTVVVVGAITQVASWPGALLLAVVGVVPPLIARQFFLAPDESISQSIQRELR